MAGITNILILGGIAGAVAYFTDCFQYCTGFKDQVDAFIDSILNPLSGDSDYTYSSYHGMAGANAGNVVDQRRLLPRPRPMARVNRKANLMDLLPSTFNEPIDPVIHPVFSGKQDVGYRNAINTHLSFGALGIS